MYFKRLIDLFVAIIIILSSLPIFILLSLLLSIVNQGDPFFTQKRPGKGEKIFSIIKFRTMTNAMDSNKVLLSDKERLTRVGRIVRKLSMDELPQLINVVKGEMSLIGPRPLLIKYLPYYSEEEKIRHQIRPGITGYAQVKGRNVLSWNERLKFDQYYVKNISPLLDLRIVFLTIYSVFSSRNVVEDPRSIMRDLDVERSA
jgi:lipopolysaccharide/colanic/teichoic acid biosynthesis glycosyltransferase